jgi:hypothetical protein
MKGHNEKVAEMRLKTMKPAFIYVRGLLLGLLAAVAVSAQDDPDLARRTLKGIKGVHVFAGVAKDIEEAGYVPTSLRRIPN